MLAVAADVARREGLPAPVPVTERYPEVGEAQEDEWQQQVVDHLGITEWVRLTFYEDNDLVGTTACEGLVGRGLLWPPAVHIKANVFRQIGPGSLLTGEGGDEVLGPRRAASWPHMSVRTPTSRRVALRGVAQSLHPAPVRARRTVARLAQADLQPWVTPEVRQRHHRLVARDDASEPLRWDRSLLWLTRRRGAVLGASNHRLVGSEHGVAVVDPLLEPTFLAALGRFGGSFGFPGRTAAMRALFADLLPPAVIERQGKASFNRAYMGAPTRRFARRWDGSGVDPAVVDADRLRQEWLSERPSALSSLLLQAAWLHTEGGVIPA